MKKNPKQNVKSHEVNNYCDELTEDEDTDDEEPNLVFSRNGKKKTSQVKSVSNGTVKRETSNSESPTSASRARRKNMGAKNTSSNSLKSPLHNSNNGSSRNQVFNDPSPQSSIYVDDSDICEIFSDGEIFPIKKKVT